MTTLAGFLGLVLAPQASIDLEHARLHVVVNEASLDVSATLSGRAEGRPSAWDLALQRTMTVRSVTAGEREVPFTADGDELRIDLSALGLGDGDALTLGLAATGSPLERFSEERGGYVRSTVGADRTYVRGQVAWYPRPPDDSAAMSIVVEAPAEWQVRTAGRLAGVDAVADRKAWTFEQESPARNVGLVAGPYAVQEVTTDDGSVLDAFVFPGDEEAAGILLATARRAFEHYVGRFGAVARDRFTLVEMPAAFGEGSGYGEVGYVLVGKGAFAVPDAPWAQDLVAHEVAHTWWGREVPFRDFANEVLATYSELSFAAADRGAPAARLKRRAAIEAVAGAAAEAHEIAFREIDGWGGSMDPRTYRVHAYEKGMMLLQMVEDAVGTKAMDRTLARFFQDLRVPGSAPVGFGDLRDALVGAGGAARKVVEQWERPGLPVLTAEYEAKESGSRWKVEGTVLQEGTDRPFELEVTLAALGGEEPVEKTVKLNEARAKFSLTTPFEPTGVVIDPDARLLVTSQRSAIADPGALFSEAFRVVNSPNDADVDRNLRAIAQLRRLLEAGVAEHPGLCHGGIGRCLFRLGRHDDARAELEEALRLLGRSQPFHRAWFHLRLGCIADLEGRREDALAHYEQARGEGASDATAKLARRFEERPYRGFEQDR